MFDVVVLADAHLFASRCLGARFPVVDYLGDSFGTSSTWLIKPLTSAALRSDALRSPPLAMYDGFS